MFEVSQILEFLRYWQVEYLFILDLYKSTQKIITVSIQQVSMD